MSGGVPTGVLFAQTQGVAAPRLFDNGAFLADEDDGDGIYDDGRYTGQVSQSTAAPIASASRGAAQGAAGSSPLSVQEHRIEVPIEFVVPYANQSTSLPAVQKAGADGPGVITVTPLPEALKARGLSPNEPIHIKSVHLEEVQNTSKHEIAAKLLGVNGADPNPTHIKGAQAAHVSWPKTHAQYNHLNGGSGKELYKSKHELSHLGVSFTPETLLSQTKPHPGQPGKLTTEVDLSGFYQSDENSHMAPLTQMGAWLVANSGSQFIDSPVIDSAIRANMPAAVTNVVGDIKITPDFAPGVVRVLIDEQALKTCMSQFSDVPTTTSPADHQVQIFRTGAKPSEPIGLLSAAHPNVTAKDVNGANETSGAVRMRLVYVIQHNGKPYQPAKGSASVKK
jgi:hypothetical protein